MTTANAHSAHAVVRRGPERQPFTLPALPLSSSARLSGHLDRAEQHARRWARDMGMVAGPAHPSAVWTAKDLDAHGYPLMCAYIHPDADAAELDLITDWYVWVFYFDDYFLKMFKKPGDRGGAIEHLRRLTDFMPRAGAPSTSASNPVEAGLADLWTRTVPKMSDCWRSRFIEVTRDLLNESLTELDTITDRRVPDPITYIELRRRVGGAPWSAMLVEHTVGEIPERCTGTRPIRVLTQTFADAVHLRNDLFSYQREVQEEGEPHNAVLVAERFFDWPTQRAAQLVADLITSRLQLFEHVAATELPELLADEAATAAERSCLRAYVQGLRDWQSGGHEWHTRSSRYMNAKTRGTPGRTAPVASGAGVTAARLIRPIPGLRTRPIPTSPSAPAPMPELSVPFPLRLSPHLDAVREYHLDYCNRFGMCDPEPGVPGSHVWTRAYVSRMDLTLCAAGVFPDGTPEELELMVCWLTLTYVDDYFPAVYGKAGRVTAKNYLRRLSAQLTFDHDRPTPRTPSERFMADLWHRTAPALTPEQRVLLRNATDSWLFSHMWEHHHIGTRLLPDPVDSMEMTRSTFGGDFETTLSHIRCATVPSEVFASTPLVDLDNAAKDLFRLLNDVVSYPKERTFEDDPVNAVVVYGHFFGLDPDQAARAVVSLHDSRLAHLQQIITVDIPDWCARNNIDSSVRAGIDTYIEGTKLWLAAVRHWHYATDRYLRSEYLGQRRRLRAHSLTGPGISGKPTRPTRTESTR